MTARQVSYPGSDDPRVLKWVATELPKHVGPSAPLAMLRELGGTFERKAQIKTTLAGLTPDNIDAFKVSGGATPASVILLAGHELSKAGLDPTVPALNEWLRNNPQLDANGVRVNVDVETFATQQRKGRKYQYPNAELEGLIEAQTKLTTLADLIKLGVHAEPATNAPGIPAQQAVELLNSLKAEYPGLNVDAALDAGSKVTGYQEARKALGAATGDLAKQAVVGPATRTVAVVAGFALAAATGAEITDTTGFVEAAVVAAGAGGALVGGNKLAHPEQRTNSAKPVRDALSATLSAAGDVKNARRESNNAVKAFHRSEPRVTPSAGRGA